MRKGRVLNYLVVMIVTALFVLVFAHHGLQATSAPQPATSVAQPPLTSVPEPQQHPVMDAIANKIIQKYQGSTCEQLWQEKAQAKNKPKSTQEQEAIGILRNDPQMRAAFINKVAPPIANKMFDCGMIP